MIKIICVGYLKEKYLKEAQIEYLKRLNKYTNVEIIELQDETNNILEKEKNKIIKYINKKDFIVTLEIDGIQQTSLEFSKFIDETLIRNANITFIIGGSYGLHEDIKKLSNHKLSFSKMTFPHQLFRIILLEQIYRSYKINNNECYHK